VPDPDPSVPPGAAALFARPERVESHACDCGDLVAAIDRLDPRPPPSIARLREDLARTGAVSSHYQPIVELDTGRTVAFEALLRVTGRDGPVPPGDLFGAAASGGWSQALDQVARRSAIIGAAGWLGDRSLFVNFVPSSIYDPNVCLRTTEQAAREAGIGMDKLVFEVVETERIRDIDHLRRIFARYHAMGARVALDDLGSGYASLAVAAELRPDVVKVDGGVVRRLPDDGDACGFVLEAVTQARSIGAVVLAEGVETQEQAELAVGLGVTLAQGWHFGHPAPAPAAGGPGAPAAT
jgi:EAL domain-containing protein (putative c-di-GMP-specific phosphodiesterase class I)